MTALLATFGFLFWRSHARVSVAAPAKRDPAPRTSTMQRAALARAAAAQPATGARSATAGTAATAPKVTMPPRDQTKPPVGKPRVRILKSPDLQPLAWDASPVPGDGPLTLARPANAAGEVEALDPMARRIRDRYLAARFPGTLRTAADLADAAAVIKAARLYFEDGLVPRANEVLDLAMEAHPEVDSPWLAALEIAFLVRDAERYVAVAHAFHRAHAHSPDWNEVVRLGRSLAPMHPLFAGPAGEARDFDHFGPWPHLPNWIGASWDLTGEVASVELRARLMNVAPAGAPPAAVVMPEAA
jgi:hypothetical protein